MKKNRIQNLGFSLLEMLVTIGAILVLVALVFPVAGTVMKKSQRAASVGNLRTISSLAANYSSEHNNYVAPYRSMEWDSAYKGMSGSYMFEYLPRFYGDEAYRVFQRPGDDLTYMGGAGRRSYRNVVVWSYARNISLPRQKGNADLTFSKFFIPSASKSMLFLETIQNGGIGIQDASLTHVYFDSAAEEGRCAVAFVDGHAELLSRSQMGLEKDGTLALRTEDAKMLWTGFPNSSAVVQY